MSCLGMVAELITKHIISAAIHVYIMRLAFVKRKTDRPKCTKAIKINGNSKFVYALPFPAKGCGQLPHCKTDWLI